MPIDLDDPTVQQALSGFTNAFAIGLGIAANGPMLRLALLLFGPMLAYLLREYAFDGMIHLVLGFARQALASPRAMQAGALAGAAAGPVLWRLVASR